MEGGVWGLVIVVSAFMIQVLSFGTSASIGVYNIEFLEYFEGETFSVSLIGSINFGVYLGSGPIVSFLMTKYSYRTIALSGSILVTVGLLAMPFLPYIPSMCLFYGVLTGFGSCCVYIPSHVLSGLYYDKYRSVATGFSTSGSGLGCAVMPVMAGILIDAFSWKGSLILVAGLNLHLFIFSALLRPPRAPDPSWKEENLMLHQSNTESQQGSIMETSRISMPTFGLYRSSVGVDTNETIAMQVIVNDIKVVEDDEGYNFWGLDSSKLDFIDKMSNTTSFSSTETLVLHSRRHKYGSVSRRPRSLMAPIQDESPASGQVIKSSSSAFLKVPRSSSNAHRLTLTSATMGWRGSSFVFMESSGEMSSSMVTDNVDSSDTVTTIPLSSQHIFIFTNYGFDIYFISNVMWNAGYAIIQSFSPEFLRERGLTLMETAWLSGTFGLGAFIGGVAGGVVGNVKGVNRQILYTLANITMGGTILLLPYSDSKILYIFILFSSGLSLGILLGLLLVVLTDLVGVESLGNGLGYLMLSNGLGTIMGPPIASLLKNDKDGFGPSILLAGVACILGGLVMLLMPCYHANLCSTTNTTSSASSANSHENPIASV